MENELFHARYYWSLLLRHPLRWLVPMAIVIAIGSVVVLLAPRTYVSVARVAVQSSQVSGSLVQSTVTNERLQFSEQRVFSRQNLVALADKFDLVPQRTGLTEGQVAEIVRQHITLEVMPLDPNDPSSNSAVLTIRFQTSTAEMAAAGVNEIIEMLIVENRNARMSEASEMRQFLEQEVATRHEQAESLDAEWNAFVAANEALLPSRLALYTSEMQDLQQEVQTIQVASASLAADIRMLQTQLSLAQSPSSSEENQLVALRQELSTKQTVFSETHPEIVSLKARIATLEANLAQIENNTVASADTPSLPSSAESALLNERIASARQQHDGFAARRIVIDQRLEWLRDAIAKMPNVEADLLSLERRSAAAEASLADMQGRLDTAFVGERLEDAQMDAQIRIIDKPEVPNYPAGSGRARALLVVAAVGLGLGLACLVLLDFLDHTIKSKRNLRPVLDGATLVLIPDWRETSGGFAKFMALLGLGKLATAFGKPMGTEPRI